MKLLYLGATETQLVVQISIGPAFVSVEYFEDRAQEFWIDRATELARSRFAISTSDRTASL